MKALLRLYSSSNKALFRLYQGSNKARLRLFFETLFLSFYEHHLLSSVLISSVRALAKPKQPAAPAAVQLQP
jgi:hypothetical protein